MTQLTAPTAPATPAPSVTPVPSTAPPANAPDRVPDTGFLRMPTPLGRLELHSIAGAVSAVRFEQDGRLPSDDCDERPNSILLDAAEQLDEYFSGSRRCFELPLVATGTPFQHAVWTALGDVGFGTAIGYGALARAAGAPGGGRAAGQAVRANTLALLVPCHRVLGSGGFVTGYSGGEGPSTKRWLLDHEGIPYRR
ncbi:MAG TPA: methylated-DNA--[protein]-cysteine S-methyltransferase [Plantibacter sp.]|uniref:methylated-DNA--[protein]-cysteine S-methyltransferase n=1 Tax=unclassified Plantibacter TaxID=2624265 RepID=UPI002C0BFF70|nr:methylated-DNA--[protein]-cysteine S-methyltransferase [Plantibacter sp.]